MKRRATPQQTDADKRTRAHRILHTQKQHNITITTTDGGARDSTEVDLENVPMRACASECVRVGVLWAKCETCDTRSLRARSRSCSARTANRFVHIIRLAESSEIRRILFV